MCVKKWKQCVELLAMTQPTINKEKIVKKNTKFMVDVIFNAGVDFSLVIYMLKL